LALAFSPVRVVAVLLAVVAGIGLSACYGSTEPATNVTFDSAQLNAQGTANNGPANSHFEYWPTSHPEAKLTTPNQAWPAGVSGPFSAKVTVLYASSEYSFRVCGNDEGKPFACAQTRTFTTPAPTRDVVEGGWSEGFHSPEGTVQASSGPAGQSPTGTIFYNAAPKEYGGRVTCMSVSGNRAVIGTVGEVTPPEVSPNPNKNPPTATLLATFVDGGPGVPDKVQVDLNEFSSTPPTCNPAANPPSVPTQGVNVYDAP
jgi:hypothetical protein